LLPPGLQIKYDLTAGRYIDFLHKQKPDSPTARVKTYQIMEDIIHYPDHQHPHVVPDNKRDVALIRGEATMAFQALLERDHHTFDTLAANNPAVLGLTAEPHATILDQEFDTRHQRIINLGRVMAEMYSMDPGKFKAKIERDIKVMEGKMTKPQEVS
jgi:hypothetical protein